MNYLLALLLFTFAAPEKTIPSDSERWGQVGHYITGEIAEHYLTDEAEKRVKEILGTTSMQMATVWMDDIRSDPAYDYTSTWHWTTIPDGMKYEDFEQEEDGDIIWALETLIEELKSGELNASEEREKLKLVMHMIGDIHQPMHVGNGDDRGGNDVRVQWMGENSNLHRVWDTDMLMSLELSYTEFAEELLLLATEDKVTEWQQASIRDWAYESMSYRDQTYDLPGNRRLGYEYRYENKDILFDRLLKAGIRMAGVLNEIYGE
jgi:hypothetical protein